MPGKLQMELLGKILVMEKMALDTWQRTIVFLQLPQYIDCVTFEKFTPLHLFVFVVHIVLCV